jgi:hypothetical protein
MLAEFARRAAVYRRRKRSRKISMPIPLGLAILDFAALLGLALAADRSGYRGGACALAAFAAVVLVWGLVAWLMVMSVMPPVR